MQLNAIPRTFFADRTDGVPAYRVLVAKVIGNKMEERNHQRPPYLWKFEECLFEEAQSFASDTRKPTLFADGILTLCERLGMAGSTDASQFNVVENIRFVFDFMRSVENFAACTTTGNYSVALTAEWSGFANHVLSVPRSAELLFRLRSSQQCTAQDDWHRQCHFFSDAEIKNSLPKVADQVVSSLLHRFSNYDLPDEACPQVHRWMEDERTQTPAFDSPY